MEDCDAAGAVEKNETSSEDPAVADHVRLVLPALPEFAQIARVAVAALALRQGFDYSEVEDLRLAVDEGMVVLLGVADRQGNIVLDVSLPRERVEVRLKGDFDGAVETSAIERFYRLVSDLVDHYEIDPDALTVEFAISHS